MAAARVNVVMMTAPWVGGREGPHRELCSKLVGSHSKKLTNRAVTLSSTIHSWPNTEPLILLLKKLKGHFLTFEMHFFTALPHAQSSMR